MVTSTANLDHLDPAGQRYCYRRLHEQEVDTETLERAAAVAAFVRADLRLHKSPRIVWIRPARVGEMPGTGVQDAVLGECGAVFTRLQRDIREGYTPCCPSLHEIWIRADLKAWPALEYVVAHELRHAWQKLTLPGVFRDTCKAEGDAYPYGYAILKQWLRAQGRLTAEACRLIDQKCEKAEALFLTECPGTPFGVLQTPPGTAR